MLAVDLRNDNNRDKAYSFVSVLFSNEICTVPAKLINFKYTLAGWSDVAETYLNTQDAPKLLTQNSSDKIIKFES